MRQCRSEAATRSLKCCSLKCSLAWLVDGLLTANKVAREFEFTPLRHAVLNVVDSPKRPEKLPMQTIWLSPTNYVTGDPTLRMSYPFASHPSTIVTCTTPGDFKWISMGLRLPANVQIKQVIICYEVTNSRSFIAQTRLAEMTTHDHANVVHDDRAHLTRTTPTSYNSAISGLIPTGAVA